MSDGLSSVSGSSTQWSSVEASQTLKKSPIPMGPGKRAAGSTIMPDTFGSDCDTSLMGRSTQVSHSGATQISSAAKSTAPSEQQEPQPESAPSPTAKGTGIDIDTHDWKTEQGTKYKNNGDQKLYDWERQVLHTQITICYGHTGDKVQGGCECIAKAYVGSFFPELKGEELTRKEAEIKQMLANGGSQQVDHRPLIAGLYGNEGFFNQVSGPLRQLIANTLDEALQRGKLDLSDNASVQAFFEKIVIFSTTARGAIAVVVGSPEAELFGHPEYPAGDPLCEQFDLYFSESQIYLARWLTSDVYPTNPYNANPEGRETLKLGDMSPKLIPPNQLGCRLYSAGGVAHAPLNMLFVGDSLFKECLEEAKRLKENPEDPEALAAFTQAMKKFMYTWSQSSTCRRGGAAVLAMLVDSMAKYAGFQLKRPEVPDEARTALARLTEEFPDRSRKVARSETGTGYSVGILGGEVPRKNDETWLKDFYYHYDVFALHMPSFKTFDERYPCEFVPIPTDETSAAST
ncbi:MAG: hypothetical protein LBD60_02140 [Puniceicoccales bacterium]|jgi:hypothetical protein|nr:hypothetical protein [Puniceicoccales bacterium]